MGFDAEELHMRAPAQGGSRHTIWLAVRRG